CPKRYRGLGKRMFRGLLKSVARVWNPKDIRESAVQHNVLTHMRAAERGLRRLDAALDRVGPEPLTRILRSMNLQSLTQVDNLQTCIRSCSRSKQPLAEKK
ncbi:MAG: hypothetical protein WBW31_24225, partial [Candidatus Sulfotelmatobacter sp.]